MEETCGFIQKTDLRTWPTYLLTLTASFCSGQTAEILMKCCHPAETGNFFTLAVAATTNVKFYQDGTFTMSLQLICATVLYNCGENVIRLFHGLEIYVL